MTATQPFSKTLCSICYEDLKPIVEDLQAISICGHVFHELCLQQWFEYCSKGKKKCPICKQTCSAVNVSRLYFESVGDLSDSNLSQKLQSHEKDPEELKLEIRRLEGTISRLRVALESREKQLSNLNDEFSVCKEQLKKEKSLKEDAMKKKKETNEKLILETQKLVESEGKCRDLEEKNNKLTKERDQLKLVCDLDLKDVKIGKAASTESHSKEIVDKLVKSLIDHNKEYKELMTKYKTLGNDEACSRKELEKSKEKLKDLKKLKEKSQKMETAKEVKDIIKEREVHIRKTKRSRVTENLIRSNNKDGDCSYILIDDDIDTPEVSISPESALYDSVPQPTKRVIIDDDVAFVCETGKDKHFSNITTEVSLPYLSSQVDPCFSARLLVPKRNKKAFGKIVQKGSELGF